MKRQTYLLSLVLILAAFCQAQKPRLVVPMGHLEYIDAAAFSPDGKQFLTGSRDYTAILWDSKGRELHTFRGHDGYINAVAFSPDGQMILTGSQDRTAKLWDLQGNVLQSFGHGHWVQAAVFAPDGQTLLTGGHDGTAKLWSLQGRELQVFNGHVPGAIIKSVAFAPDGKLVLTGCTDGTAKLWDLNGKVLETFKVDKGDVIQASFSPDGQSILILSFGQKASLWDLDGRKLTDFAAKAYLAAFALDGQSILIDSGEYGISQWDLAGQKLKSFPSRNDDDTPIVFSPDRKQVLTLGEIWDMVANLWDLDGHLLQQFRGRSSRAYSVAFSPDGQKILTGNGDGTAKLWDLRQSGLRTFDAFSFAVYKAVFSPDGKLILGGGFDRNSALKLWDINGQVLQAFEQYSGNIQSVAFSPDGQSFLSGNADGTPAILWDLQGKVLQTFEGISVRSNPVTFSPDGQQILTGSFYDQIKRRFFSQMWSLKGEKLQLFHGHDFDIHSIAFSPDGQLVATAGGNGSVILWDRNGEKLKRFPVSDGPWSAIFSPDGKSILVGSQGYAKLLSLDGQELQSFQWHQGSVTSVAFSPDGQKVLTGSWDNTCKLWSLDGQELATLIAIDSADWVVTTPAGFFDASPGAMQLMYYVQGLEPIELEQLKERYYEPGLIGKIMGFNKESLRDVTTFDAVPLYPEVKLELKGDQLYIALSPRSGGLGRTALFINGSEKVADLNPGRLLRIAINLRDYQQYYFTGQANTIGIQSFNEAGWLGSQLASVEYSLPKPTPLQLNTEPRIYALCIGTADYARGTALDLAFAEQDALRLAQALELGGKALLNDPARVEVLTLTTCLGKNCPDAQRPTKKNIQSALSAFAKKARPEDVFLLYLSGHGKVYQDYFYYLTQDMGSDYLGDDAIRVQYAISSAEFAEWLNAIPARKQVMMIDACASGQFNEDMALLAMKAVPGSQIRALDRLRDRTGIFIISGSANDQASYEASPYGMGLLTYSLLTGMSGGALREDEYMDVEKLFHFAEEQVPVLAEDVGAIQTPKYWKPEGSKSFDIGRATPEVKKAIQLPSPKPLFVRVSFINDETFGDELKLEETLNGLLRDFTFAKGEDKALLFVDADDHPNAYRLRGKYALQGDKVRVEYFVFKGNEKVGGLLVVEMPSTNLEALGRKIIARAYEVAGE